MPPTKKTDGKTANKRGGAKESAASFSVKAKTFDEILRSRVSRARIKKNIAQELIKMRKPSAEAKTYSSPYIYVYADYLKTDKYEKMTRAIENRLTDLGIGGRIHRLSQYKNLEELIEEDARRGASTVVIVGDDKIVEEAIRVIADLDITLGIIPMGGGEDKIASLLGIPEGALACDILSQRIIEHLDLGRINGKIFISRLSIFGQRVPIVCDKKYEITSLGGDVLIYNLNLDFKDKSAPGADPKDGRFEVLVNPKKSFGRFGFGEKRGEARSLFFAKELRMKSAVPFSVFVDGKKNFYKDADIEIVPKGLKVVVGKGRLI